MSKTLPAELTVVILTLNEEVHIERALGNVEGWAEAVFVLDSGSADRTIELVEAAGARTFFRKFDNYAAQRNHAIRELPVKTEWMLFLDADEYLTEELKAEISSVLRENPPFEGFMLKRRFYFMGRWIRHGGYYPTRLLRLFKREKARCDREINEHVEVDGQLGNLRHDFVDENLKGLRECLLKHVRYAEFEAGQFEREAPADIRFWRSGHDRKQWLRYRVWNRWLPPFARPFIYFFHRYFIRLGLLDGLPRLVYHYKQGLVLHFTIDAFAFENRLRDKQKKTQCAASPE